MEQLKKFIIAKLLGWILPKGLEWVQSAYEAHKEEIEKKVAEFVPGEIADELAIAAVHGLMKIALDAAKKYLESLGGEALAAPSVAAAMAHVDLELAV